MKMYCVTMFEERDGPTESDTEVSTVVHARDYATAVEIARCDICLEHRNVNMRKLWAWSAELLCA